MLENPFLSKPFFCIVSCHPSLSTASKEIFFKKEKKNLLKGLRGGVRAKRTYPLKGQVVDALLNIIKI